MQKEIGIASMTYSTVSESQAEYTARCLKMADTFQICAGYISNMAEKVIVIIVIHNIYSYSRINS